MSTVLKGSITYKHKKTTQKNMRELHTNIINTHTDKHDGTTHR